MPNPMHFDSDWDYYNACMSPVQQIMQAIDDGEREMDSYLDWGKKRYPELTERELMADETIMADYAEYVIEIDAMNQEPS